MKDRSTKSGSATEWARHWTALVQSWKYCCVMYVPESENSENSKTVKEGSMKNVQW